MGVQAMLLLLLLSIWITQWICHDIEEEEKIPNKEKSTQSQIKSKAVNANEIETNPGPPTANFEWLKNYIGWESDVHRTDSIIRDTNRAMNDFDSICLPYMHALHTRCSRILLELDNYKNLSKISKISKISTISTISTSDTICEFHTICVYPYLLMFTRMLELNGLFTAALCLLYSHLLNNDLLRFVSFTRNFWNRVLNSLFNSVSVFWLPQMERNFGVSWKTGKRDEYFVIGNAIYGMVVVFTCLNVGLDIEQWSMFSDSSMVIRLLLLVLIYKHVWEIIKVSLICGSGFPSCQISPDSTRRETQITGNNGNCHGILRSFARMHCRGGNMDDSFEVGGAVALHQNPVSSHSNLFNVEDSKQNKEVKMFDPQNLLKLANDIESNPGPPYMCIIQEFLDGNHEYRSQNKEQLLQAVSKLDKDAKDGKIQACMYTEQNLITLYNIFDVSIREKYPQKIMTEIENLANHWNKEVRQEELRLRSERKERSELVIAINPDETTESNKERENAHNNTEQHVLQGQMTGQRKPKDGTRKGKQYKMKTSSVKKNRLHRGDWNPYGPKKNPELPVHGEPPS